MSIVETIMIYNINKTIPKPETKGLGDFFFNTVSTSDCAAGNLNKL